VRTTSPDRIPEHRSGQSTGISPPFSASLTATFTQPLPHSLNFIAEVSPYFSSRYDMMDDPLQHQAMAAVARAQPMTASAPKAFAATA
jgi:hypothetical protein